MKQCIQMPERIGLRKSRLWMVAVTTAITCAGQAAAREPPDERQEHRRTAARRNEVESMHYVGK